MKKNLERNIILFYILRALTLPYFWLPILYYYLTAIKGFSVTETTILLGLQEFLLIFLEVPTGVVADKISRKFSVGLGIAITSLPLAILPWTDSYLAALIIFSTRAIGKALVSGADSSLLYDTLVDLNRTNEYKKIKTMSAAVVMAGATVCMLIGGWMGQNGLYTLALVLPLPLQLIAALAVSFMVEPESSIKAKQIQESNYFKHINLAIRVIMKSRTLVMLTLAFALIEGTAVNMKWYYPAIFESLGFGLGIAGTVMALLYGAKTVINTLGAKLMVKDAYQNTFLWTGLISASWVVAAIMLISSGVVVAIIVILLGLEIASSSSEELIHDELDSSVRATAMSFVNLFSSVAATVLLWIWGVSVQHGTMQTSLATQGLLFFAIGLMLWLARGRAISEK